MIRGLPHRNARQIGVDRIPPDFRGDITSTL